MKPASETGGAWVLFFVLIGSFLRSSPRLGPGREVVRQGSEAGQRGDAALAGWGAARLSQARRLRDVERSLPLCRRPCKTM